MIGPKTKTNYIMTVMIQWIRPGPGAASTELNQCSEQDTVMYEGYSSSMLTSILLEWTTRTSLCRNPLLLRIFANHTYRREQVVSNSNWWQITWRVLQFNFRSGSLRLGGDKSRCWKQCHRSGFLKLSMSIMRSSTDVCWWPGGGWSPVYCRYH